MVRETDTYCCIKGLLPYTMNKYSELRNRLARFESYYEFIGKKVFISAEIASLAGAFVIIATSLIDFYYLGFKDPFMSMMTVRFFAALILVGISIYLKQSVLNGNEIIYINIGGALSATLLIYGYSYIFPNLDYLPFILIYYMFATTVIAPLLSFSGFIIPYSYLVTLSLYILFTEHAELRDIETFVIFSIPTLIFLWVLIITQRKMSLATYNYAFESHTHATLDSLSHLLNRRAWYIQSFLRWNETKRHNQPLALIMIDIDHFKSVNDTWGHECGDLVIESVSAILLDETRDYDIVGRLGGEEFAILLPQTLHNEAMIIAERIRSAIENHEIEYYKCNKIKITISIGVVQIENHINSLDELIARADELLYEAKNSGRNRICTEYDVVAAEGPLY